MHNFFDVPNPDDSHFVGIVFPFKMNGSNYVFCVKDRDLMRNHINTKFPGGSNEEWYEDDFSYEDDLFKTLDILGFKDKKVQVRIYQNYKKQKKAFDENSEHKPKLYVLRTMVMESLKNLGYYPLDIAPKIVEFVEKSGHTQYFVEVTEFIDANGERVLAPDTTKKFKALDSDVIESRIPLMVSDFEQLIHSHKSALKKYLQWKVKEKEYSLEETFGLAVEEPDDAEGEED